VRKHALEFAITSPAESDIWGAEFFAEVLKDKEAINALEAINVQRNNLAHGRKTLPVIEIKKLMRQSLRLDAWAKIPEMDGNLRLTDWAPWVVALSSTAKKTGLFERWQKNVIRYLIPETGEVFKVPRKSVAPAN
jgi:hypothetical protein